MRKLIIVLLFSISLFTSCDSDTSLGNGTVTFTLSNATHDLITVEIDGDSDTASYGFGVDDYDPCECESCIGHAEFYLSSGSYSYSVYDINDEQIGSGNVSVEADNCINVNLN